MADIPVDHPGGNDAGAPSCTATGPSPCGNNCAASIGAPMTSACPASCGCPIDIMTPLGAGASAPFLSVNATFVPSPGSCLGVISPGLLTTTNGTKAYAGACSSGDSRPTATVAPAPTVVTPKDAAPPSSDAGADASDAAPVVCNTLAPGGAEVAVSATTGPPPAATGGAIPPGTYHLTHRDFFQDFAELGATPSIDLVKRTLVIDPTTIEITEAVNPNDPDAGAAIWSTSNASQRYTIFGVVLSETESCPAPGSVRNLAFSIVGSELWLFPSTEQREIYTKQ